MKNSSLHIFIQTYWLALVTLVLFLSITFLFFKVIRDWTEERNEKHFEFRASAAESSIQRRLTYYIQLLKAGKAFYNNTDTLTRADWKKFVGNLQIDQAFPGIQGLGFSIFIDKESLPAHLKQIRKEGFPDYIIKPEGERDFYTSIIFLEPFDWRNQRAFGFDMYTEPIRRTAMIRARDNDVPAMSGKVKLVQETRQDVQPGFLIYLPLYKKGTNPRTIEERRKYFVGYIYSPFRVKDLMQGILSNEFKDIHIEIFDGRELTSKSLLYDSDSISTYKRHRQGRSFHKLTYLDVAGRTWAIYFSAKESFGFPTEKNLAYTVLVGGVIISLLTFSIIYSVLNARQKQEKSNAEIRVNAAKLEEANNKLSLQNQELIRINNDLDNFIYAASHDLKAPILNIEGLIQALKDYADKEEVQELVNLMEVSVNRFKSTIFDLTEITKAQKSSLDEVEEIRFEELLKEIKLDIKELISLTHAKIYCDFSDKPTIRFSRKNIRSILYNLVSNAIKYRSPNRAPEVFISTKSHNNSVVITVKDNGLGISEKNKDKVFSMFKRMHDHVEGSGVGLYIVKRIVDNAGGKIELKSTLGEGSLFTIKLPGK